MDLIGLITDLLLFIRVNLNPYKFRLKTKNNFYKFFNDIKQTKKRKNCKWLCRQRYYLQKGILIQTRPEYKKIDYTIAKRYYQEYHDLNPLAFKSVNDIRNHKYVMFVKFKGSDEEWFKYPVKGKLYNSYYIKTLPIKKYQNYLTVFSVKGIFEETNTVTITNSKETLDVYCSTIKPYFKDEWENNVYELERLKEITEKE